MSRIASLSGPSSDYMDRIHQAAAEAEEVFNTKVKTLFPEAQTEEEQKAIASAFSQKLDATPDILFPRVETFGMVPARWVEFKNFHGKETHKHYADNRRQYLKYLRRYGPGVVVYGKGCDTGLHADLQGVSCFGQSEVFWWIDFILDGKKAPTQMGVQRLSPAAPIFYSNQQCWASQQVAAVPYSQGNFLPYGYYAQ